MTNIFIDSDIIIDLLAKREHYLEAAELFSIIRNRKLRAYTTPLVLANVDYIITKYSNRQRSKKAIRELRKYLSILSMDENAVDKAMDSPLTDFEDALQNYAAEYYGDIDVIITRNTKDFKKSEIGVMTPESYLKTKIASR